MLKFWLLIVKVTTLFFFLFKDVNLILICPSTFGMCRQGEHALKERFTSPGCDENTPKLKLTDCTLTSLQHFKVITLHNQKMCDLSAGGACCVMLQ